MGASSCTKYAAWSDEFAMKILRYLKDSKAKGILISATGDLTDLKAWTDAGYARADTKSQSGLIIRWGGSIIVWRSSRQTISILSTAEAELNAATLGWQIVRGLRFLLSDFCIDVSRVKVLIDNQAALSIAMCGSNWRTRYFSVRARRLNEEYQKGRAVLEHCPTKEMLADTLTKLATTPVIQVLLDAMDGIHNTDHQASVSPSHKDSSDKSGDGPGNGPNDGPGDRPGNGPQPGQPRHKVSGSLGPSNSN